MASVCMKKDTGQWMMDFRPVFGRGTQRRNVRLPKGTSRDEAEAICRECEALCRKLEENCNKEDARRALFLKAITPEQFEQLVNGLLVTPKRSIAPVTIEELWQMHPATRTQQNDNPSEFLYHGKCLRDFTAHTGIANARDLNLQDVQLWIAELQRRGYAWDTRRHHLLPLRRASRMAGSSGLVDCLTGIVLDRSKRRLQAPVGDVQGVIRLLALPDTRMPLAASLMAFMGLRPSEVIRLTNGDVSGGVLSVGVNTSKNPSSRRDLPIPKSLQKFIAATGEPHLPMLQVHTGHGNPKGLPFDLNGLSHWMRKHGLECPPKYLRKAFITWAVEIGVDPMLIETWVGHQNSLVLPITAKHYLSKLSVERLMPVAKKISEAFDRLWTPLLTPLSTPRTKRSQR